MEKQYRAERFDFTGWFVEGKIKLVCGRVVLVDEHGREYHVKPETLTLVSPNKEEVELFYFGIRSNNQNLSNFILIKETDNRSYTDFDIIEDCKKTISKEDKYIILELAIDLTTFGNESEFDALSGNNLTVVKLKEKEMLNFVNYQTT